LRLHVIYLPMLIKIINTSKHPLPAYETVHAAGMDLRANLAEEITLKPLARALVPTGLFVEIPVGYEAQIRPRSGLAFKQGITCLNTPGTIDADYRGEIKVLLVNLSDADVCISDGTRIAQMIVSKHETVAWEQVESLEETARGSGGFGHTGK
jgi:dUTP pyrophosphatase